MHEIDIALVVIFTVSFVVTIASLMAIAICIGISESRKIRIFVQDKSRALKREVNTDLRDGNSEV